MSVFGIDVSFSDLFGSSSNQGTSGNQDVQYSGGTTTKKGTDSGQYTTTGTSGSNSITAGSGSQVGSSASNTNSSSHTYNSGRTDVQQLMITKEGIDNIMRTILESNQGLAAVTSGQHAGGLYDSTTNQLMVDDLLTRTAGYAAEKGAANVTKIGDSYSDTNSSSTTNASSNLNTNNVSTVMNSPTNSYTLSGPRTLEEVTTESPKEIKSTSSSQQQQQKDGLLDWIICTELFKQNRFGYKQYIVGSAKFAEYDEQIKKGYYIWAVPSVHHLRRHPNSIYSKFLEVWFNARANHILTLKHMRGPKSVLNPIAYYGTHAICWLLSRTIAAYYNYSTTSVYGVTGGNHGN